MNALSASPPRADVIPLVDVMTSPWRDKTIGYRLGGFNPGPSVLVAGHDPVAALVFDRLLQLPTLAWMRGTLNLIFLNALEREGLERHISQMIEPKPDERIYLPYVLDETHHVETANEGYWSVLRTCKDLGMIEGRGVKPPPFEFVLE